MSLSSKLKHRLLLFLGPVYSVELATAVDSATSGDISSITAGTGLTGGGSSGGVTLNVDVGTTANKVVRLDGDGKLPAVDGSALTNLPSGGGGNGWTKYTIPYTDLNGGWTGNELTVPLDVVSLPPNSYITGIASRISTVFSFITDPAPGSPDLIAFSLYLNGNGSSVFDAAVAQLTNPASATVDRAKLLLGADLISTFNGINSNGNFPYLNSSSSNPLDVTLNVYAERDINDTDGPPAEGFKQGSLDIWIKVETLP